MPSTELKKVNNSKKTYFQTMAFSLAL